MWQELNAFVASSQETLQLCIARQDFEALLRVLSVMAEIRQREPYADNVFKPLKDIMALLKTYNVEYEAQLLRNIEQLPLHWQQLKQQALAKQEALQDTRFYQQQRVTALIGLHTCHVQHYAKQFQKMPVSEINSSSNNNNNNSRRRNRNRNRNNKRCTAIRSEIGADGNGNTFFACL